MSVNEIIMSLEMGLIYGIIAMGIYLTFRVIDFPDLTCDGSFVLGAAVSSMLIKMGYPPLLSLGIALLAGSVAGVMTGVLYTQFKISNLLSGILVAFMLYSINLYIMGGIPNITLLENNTFLSDSPLCMIAIISLVVALGMSYLLMTDFGLGLRSIGQNKVLAQNKGINVSLITVIGLALSNALIALGGALFSQHQGFADIGSGIGTLIVGLASVMIGERIFPYSSMFSKMMSCLIGSVLYRLVISLALYSDFLGLQTQNLNLVTGILVIAIMSLPRRQYVKFE